MLKQGAPSACEPRRERDHALARRVGRAQPHRADAQPLRARRGRGSRAATRRRARAALGSAGSVAEVIGTSRIFEVPGRRTSSYDGWYGDHRRARERHPALPPLVEQRVHAGVHGVAEALEDGQGAAVEAVAARAIGGGPHADARLDGLRSARGAAGRAAPGAGCGDRCGRRGPRAGRAASSTGAGARRSRSAPTRARRCRMARALRPRGHLVGDQVGRPHAVLVAERLQRGQALRVLHLLAVAPAARPLVVGLGVDAHEDGRRASRSSVHVAVAEHDVPAAGVGKDVVRRHPRAHAELHRATARRGTRGGRGARPAAALMRRPAPAPRPRARKRVEDGGRGAHRAPRRRRAAAKQSTIQPRRRPR